MDHAIHCTVENFPGLEGLFSPYPYYPQIQFILLNLAVNGPVKKNFKSILTSLTIALKNPSGKAILNMKIHPFISKLLNVDTHLGSLDASWGKAPCEGTSEKTQPSSDCKSRLWCGKPRWKAPFASLYHSLEMQFTHATAVAGQDGWNLRWPATIARQIIYKNHFTKTFRIE